jgi:chromosome segregation ATPase
LSTEDRVAELESAFVTLTQLVRSHGERFDTHMGWINQLGAAQAALTAAQANSEQKIAALVDAQIHTESVIRELAEAQKRTEATVNALASKVDALTDLIKRQGES